MIIHLGDCIVNFDNLEAIKKVYSEGDMTQPGEIKIIPVNKTDIYLKSGEKIRINISFETAKGILEAKFALK